MFCNRGNFATGSPLENKSDAPHALNKFFHKVGIPTEMLTDGAKELHIAQWSKHCKKHKIHHRQTEPHTPWQNPTESIGGIIKRKVRANMRDTNTPIRLWDYCWDYSVDIWSLTATNSPMLDGVTGFEKVMGYTPDISEYINFSWFDWVWYHDPTDPVDKFSIGRWCGAAHNSDQGMAYHVLTEKGQVVTRSTVFPFKEDEIEDPNIVTRCTKYTESMESIIGNYCKATLGHVDQSFDEEDPYRMLFDFEDEDRQHEETITKENIYYSDPPSAEKSDNLLGLKVRFDSADGLEGTIKSRKRSSDGLLVGTHNPNPICDTRVYKVEFPDGNFNEYSANVILENLYEQVDNNGSTSALFQGITAHRTNDSALQKSNGWIQMSNGARKRKVTTDGWDIQVDLADGTQLWLPLKDVKGSNPIELAEYAKSRQIDDDSVFA